MGQMQSYRVFFVYLRKCTGSPLRYSRNDDMTPQIDDGPRMPFGRYGREPSGEPGKLSPPALMQSECIAGDAGIPSQPIRSRSGSKDTRGDWPEQSCAPEFSGRVRRRRRPHLGGDRDHVPHAAFVLTMFKTQSETDNALLHRLPLFQSLLRL